MSRKAVQLITGALMLTAWAVMGVNGLPTPRLDSLVNYPNPFDSRQSATIIAYSLKNDTSVTVRLYDLLGSTVREWNFASGQPGARQGENRFAWDGTNESGDKVAAGGYLCQVIADEDDGRVQGLRKIGVIR